MVRNFSIYIDYADIGQRIKALRVQARLSQEQLAEKAELSVSHISHIENATTKISLPSLVAIANFFEVSLDYLLCGSLKASQESYIEQISEILLDCSEKDARIIFDAVTALAASLQKHS